MDLVRILALVDLHGSSRALETIHDFVAEHDPDIVTISGDLTHFGPAQWAKDLLESFELPVLAVNGNCDTPDVTRLLEGMPEIGLMDRSRSLLNMNFMGLGYPPGCVSVTGQVDVLITHLPPTGCNDEVRPGINIGDDTVRDIALRSKPRLLLSGHVHEARGICELGSTVCVNPGPAMSGCAAIINMDERVEVKLLRL
ncbi:MAG: metallophosphoesterase family protein [Thermoplasmata archaeon]|nr:metallophosphoesterase family protein [Thermoplasmata archaeon]